MDYLILKIIICLLLAFLLGLLIGWLIRSLSGKHSERELHGEIKAHKLSIQQMEKDLEFAKSETDNARQEREASAARVHNLLSANETLLAQLESLKSESEELSGSKDSHRKLISDLTNDLNLARSDRDHLSRKLRDASNEKSRMQAEIERLNEELGVVAAAPVAASLMNDPDSLLEDYSVEEIEGIGSGFGKRLRSIGIETTADLIEQTRTDDDSEKIAASVKVDKDLVRKWGVMANLLRVPGIRGQGAELLQISGIESIADLIKQDATELTRLMIEVNAREHRTPVNPTEEMVRGWIEEAAKMPAG